MLNPRQAIRQSVHELVGRTKDSGTRPDGGPGLFPPGSIARRVHGDFTSMMVGGVGALFLQMLHPSALAGVWDYSNFRQDSLGRLQRTAQFISHTTFGSTMQAQAAIDRVKTVHAGVRGVLPDGTPYSADDPCLLTFVHIAGASSFLEAYLRYRDPLLPGAAQDRYFSETAQIARLLGAEDVPTNRTEVNELLWRTRPILRLDDRTWDVRDALLKPPDENLLSSAFRRSVMEAGLELLPDWAFELHGSILSPLRRRLARARIHSAGAVIRWALEG